MLKLKAFEIVALMVWIGTTKNMAAEARVNRSNRTKTAIEDVAAHETAGGAAQRMMCLHLILSWQSIILC